MQCTNWLRIEPKLAWRHHITHCVQVTLALWHWARMQYSRTRTPGSCLVYTTLQAIFWRSTFHSPNWLQCTWVDNQPRQVNRKTLPLAPCKSEFDFDVIHRGGIKQKVSDGLSPLFTIGKTENQLKKEIQLLAIHNVVNTNTSFRLKWLQKRPSCRKHQHYQSIYGHTKIRSTDSCQTYPPAKEQSILS